jgi:hypothetical protein
MDRKGIARAVAVGLAAAAGVGLALGRRRAGGGRRTPGGPPGEPWTCACGQAYRVAGEGRHRVYWLTEAPESDPVMGATCVRCGQPLPS